MSRSSYACVRHIFCWLNVILWISGCGLLGVGLWLRIAYKGYAALLPNYYFISADSLAIAMGTIAFCLSFCACCGSWFQSRFLLITYFGFVVFMFVFEFLLGSLAFVYRKGLGHQLELELKDGLKRHYNKTETVPNSLVAIWDHLQSEFHCCGVTNYEDWFMIDSWPNERWVPDSCCKSTPMVVNCGKMGDADLWYQNGCSEQVLMWFIQRLHVVGVVGLAVAFIQLFGLISSMLLFCTVKYKRTSQTYKSYDTTP